MPEGTRAHAVHRPRLQVHQDGARHVLVSCRETSCWRGPSAPPAPPGSHALSSNHRGSRGWVHVLLPQTKGSPLGRLHMSTPPSQNPPQGPMGLGAPLPPPTKKKITHGVQLSCVHAPIPPKPRGVSWSSFSPCSPPNHRVPRGWGHLSVPTPPCRDAGGGHKGGCIGAPAPGGLQEASL